MARFPAARQQLLLGPAGLSPAGLSPTGLSPAGLSPAGLRRGGRRRRRVGEFPVGIFLRAFQDGDDEQHREVGKAALPEAHHCENSLPSWPLPGAPLFTSETPPFCGSSGCTICQVVVLSAIGSSGTLRR